tara:strand:- start:6303 stop:6926 length:624 start_codon:yes stop_codon:yes gene_type:complete
LKLTKNLYIPLILLTVLISVFSNFGSIIFVIEPLTFTKINVSNGGYISMTSVNQTFFIDNQWWRLISPILIHFSFTHLAFNCLWIYVLGEKIERVDSKTVFVLLVIFSSICSNFLQYYWTSSSLFGGLSGVIYGLLGYCMILEMESDDERYELPPALYMFMIIWLLLGFFEVLDMFGFGKVANFAHLGGLISGMMFGMMYKYYKKIS